MNVVLKLRTTRDLVFDHKNDTSRLWSCDTVAIIFAFVDPIFFGYFHTETLGHLNQAHDSKYCVKKTGVLAHALISHFCRLPLNSCNASPMKRKLTPPCFVFYRWMQLHDIQTLYEVIWPYFLDCDFFDKS